MNRIPTTLHDRAFSTAEASMVGVSRRMLQGRRFTRLHRGVYCIAAEAGRVDVLADAALMAVGPGHVVSHLTALRLYGLSFGPLKPVHVASSRLHHTRIDGIAAHRHTTAIPFSRIDGRPVTTALRTFVDSCTLLNDRHALAVADWMASTGLVTVEELRSFVSDSHLDGVQRARRAAKWASASVESVRESDVRWIIVQAGLPAPCTNQPILDRRDQQIARGDLTYPSFKVVVEYDGWQHERDARQRQWDHLRRETLEAAGWRLVVVTTADMASPRSIAIRVHQVLRQRGYRGPGPRFAR